MQRTLPPLLAVMLMLTIPARGQNVVNGDLNGVITGTSSIPTSWNYVPDFDPVCLANNNFSATPDLCDLTQPDAFNGINGTPFHGPTFLSGLDGDGGFAYYHEGIMQVINGMVPGNTYTVRFYQAVVKQSNAIDPSGSWAVYINQTLAGISAPSVDPQAYDTVTLFWQLRTIQFTATSGADTLKFLPWDDDANHMFYNGSGVDPTGALRMGLDSISIVPGCLIQPLSLGPDTTICQGDSLVLNAGMTGTYLWQNGSTASSFTVMSTGDYWLRIITPCDTVSDTIHVNVSGAVSLDLGADTLVCQGNPFLLDATNPGVSYLWSDGSTQPTLNVSGSGTYWVQITASCGILSDTINVLFDSIPPVDLGPDTFVCANGAVFYDVTYPGATYLWSNGFNISQINVTAGGTYWVQLSNGCGTAADTVQVDYFTLPAPLAIPSDSVFCFDFGDSLHLTYTLPQGVTAQWSNGGSGTSVYMAAPGSYTVTLTSVCGTLSQTISLQNGDCPDTCSQYIVPNVFTPDGDAINDTWYPTTSCPLESYALHIYNRWGFELYTTSDITAGWDGRFNNGLCPQGVYYYVMEFYFLGGAHKTDKGFFSLFGP